MGWGWGTLRSGEICPLAWLVTLWLHRKAQTQNLGYLSPEIKDKTIHFHFIKEKSWCEIYSELLMLASGSFLKQLSINFNF